MPSCCSGEGLLSCLNRVDVKFIFRIAQAVFGVIAVVCFFLGITDSTPALIRAEGYNEVFTVLGALFVIPVVYTCYTAIARFLPKLPPSSEISIWVLGLRVVLVIAYLLQTSLLLVYLIMNLGPLAALFSIGDILILAIMVMKAKYTSFWANLYSLLITVKIGVFWPHLSSESFNNKDNEFGRNGLLATLFITIGIIQFPVVISRVSTGSTIFEAFTTKMAAVFAHTLHLLDVLELYFLGVNREQFPDDVQYLIQMFVTMGMVTCNLYYIALFFRDKTVEQTLRKFNPVKVDVFLGGEEQTKDEDLLHYFVWMLFFVDLPYSCMRFIAWLVHGTFLSVFFAKNLMMVLAVAFLMVRHSRQTA